MAENSEGSVVPLATNGLGGAEHAAVASRPGAGASEESACHSLHPLHPSSSRASCQPAWRPVPPARWGMVGLLPHLYPQPNRNGTFAMTEYLDGHSRQGILVIILHPSILPLKSGSGSTHTQAHTVYMLRDRIRSRSSSLLFFFSTW